MNGWKNIYDDANVTLKCNGKLCYVELHIAIDLTINAWNLWYSNTVFSDSSFSKYMPSKGTLGTVSSFLTESWILPDGQLGVSNQSNWDYTGKVEGVIIYPMK